MSILEMLQWVQGTEPGIALRKSNHLVGAAFQLAHILGFVLLLASVTLISLRLLGLAFVRQAPARIVHTGNTVLGISLAAAVLSGMLIFLSGPVRYYSNEFFRIKIVVLICAVLFQGDPVPGGEPTRRLSIPLPPRRRDCFAPALVRRRGFRPDDRLYLIWSKGVAKPCGRLSRRQWRYWLAPLPRQASRLLRLAMTGLRRSRPFKTSWKMSSIRQRMRYGRRSPARARLRGRKTGSPAPKSSGRRFAATPSSSPRRQIFF